MGWRADEAYRAGLDFFGSAVEMVAASGPDAWAQPSGCAGWRALDVLGHVGAATEFGTSLLRGEAPTWQPSEPPGAAVTGDPVAWWAERARRAADAVASLDLDTEVESPQGRRTIGQGLSFPAVDLFVHAWDLARAADRTVEIPSAAIEFTHGLLDPMPTDTVRSSRVFGPQVNAPADASPSEEFLAWTGRDPRWAPARRRG